MAQLSTIIGSILRDMIVAQHEANLYAMSLEDIYKQNARLEQFAVPAVAIGDMELDLRYGVKSETEESEQYEVDYPSLRKLAKSASLQSAHTIVNKTLPLLQAAFPYNGTDAEAKVLADFTVDKDMQQRYCAFLNRKIQDSLKQSVVQLVSEDGNINENLLTDCILSVCEENLLYHKDLLTLFSRPGGDGVREQIRGAIQQALSSLTPKLLKNACTKRKRIMPAMDVVVNADELSSLPADCVHTLHLRISPNNLKQYTDE
jgi:hypothetical protein